MKIIVKESNKDRLNAIIKTAEGRSTARTITADDIIKTADRISRRLGIAKKHMIGITADVDFWAQDFPNCYRFPAESTQFMMEYSTSGWTVYSVERAKTRRASQAVILNLTETAKAAIIAEASTIPSHEI